ncbi:hypothetical protein HMPREF2738_01184 [Clostridiales bacterium KLE1615]|nr:hypothetical protein HMPREF2738_01184 [Clostridiales bacterium KLE1615]
MNPGLAVVKDGNPPLTGYRFRRSSDLIEWSAWPAREVVTRIDFVFSIWKNPNRGDVFLFTVHEHFIYSSFIYFIIIKKEEATRMGCNKV